MVVAAPARPAGSALRRARPARARSARSSRGPIAAASAILYVDDRRLRGERAGVLRLRALPPAARAVADAVRRATRSCSVASCRDRVPHRRCDSASVTLWKLCVLRDLCGDRRRHVVAAFTNWPMLSKRRCMMAITETNLATALQAAGRPAEAIDHFRRAIALEPDYAPAYNNLGVVQRATGDVDERRRFLPARAGDHGRLSGRALQPRECAARTAQAARGGRALPASRSGRFPIRPAQATTSGSRWRAKAKARTPCAAFRAAVAADPTSAKAHRNLGGCVVGGRTDRRSDRRVPARDRARSARRRRTLQLRQRAARGAAARRGDRRIPGDVAADARTRPRRTTISASRSARRATSTARSTNSGRRSHSSPASPTPSEISR